ncbi:MAG TPA: ion channel [Acidocella sp.]|nr:ion channel [Acidocella sp.]
MKTPRHRRKQSPLPLSAEALRRIERRGVTRHGLQDLYYNLMTMPVPALFGVLAGYFLFTIMLSAIILHFTGGLGGNTHGSFGDAFFFSVQTLSTTGYGDIYPVTMTANIIASVGMVLGQLNTAIAIGVLFARLSRPRPRVLFSNVLVTREVNGVRRIMFRVGNERRSEISAAHISVVLISDEDDGDGGIMRHLLPLRLERDFSPVFSLSWLVIHEITEDSPLWGRDHEVMARKGNVLVCSLTGTDDAINVSVSARHVYGAEDVRAGHRFVDVISRGENGEMSIDYSRFHDTVHCST